jgi:hypothetical protein
LVLRREEACHGMSVNAMLSLLILICHSDVKVYGVEKIKKLLESIPLRRYGS